MNTIDNNNDFEQLLNNYLIEAKENLSLLNKRNAKKAGRKKARCAKGSYILDMNNIKENECY